MPVDVLLLDIVVILVAARLLGWLAKKVGQPSVIGEILAGILLGPTLLGHFDGGALFPEAVHPALTALADMGLVLFMFVVGLELDQKLVRGKAKVAVSIASGSTLLPFALGIGLALWLADEHGGDNPIWFVIFFGAAMSATAFPVLARILTDRRMEQTQPGGLALASAAIIDVFVWIVFAVIVAFAGTGEEGQWHTILAIPFVILMIVVVRPLLRRLVTAFQQAGRLTPGLLALVLLGLVASSWATEWMHIHFIFGAFLFGAVMPREGAEALTHEILERLEQLAVLLLLPMFFVVSGLNVDLSALKVDDIGVLLAILAVAIGGKLIGTYVAARLAKVPGRQASLLATLLNTRGLTEIVILSVGLEKGLLNQELFSLMVVMALVTTALSGWMQKLVYSDRRVARDIAEAERAQLGEHAAYRSMALVPSIVADTGLAKLATYLTAGYRPAEVVLGHLRPYPRTELEVGGGLTSELADMAGAMGELERLAGEVGTAEVPAKVVSRFGRDTAAELPDFVDAAEPDLVLLSSDVPGLAAVRAAHEDRLVIVNAERRGELAEDGSGSLPSVAVRHDGGIAADIAAELALRISTAAGVPLVAVGGRRAQALVGRLGKVGVAVSQEETPPLGALVVAADGSAEAADAHLLVRPERDADAVDWAEVAEELRGARAEEPDKAGELS